MSLVIISLIILFLGGAFYGFNGFYKVEEGYVGVVYRFGKL